MKYIPFLVERPRALAAKVTDEDAVSLGGASCGRDEILLDTLCITLE